uniref:Uncharacterized protein n=1 Tax=viral metagenome TaxID=1070528 RepID=A0A6M3LJU5_9ZZZZ
MESSHTAFGAYGFNGWTPSAPGGVAVMPETQVGVTGDIPGPALPRLPILGSNPLFWLLALALIWSGYVYGAFDIGFKKLGSSSFKVGRK